MVGVQDDAGGDRFEEFKRKLWVPYRQAQDVEHLVANMRRGPTPLRARSILLIGPSGVGKSAFGKRIARSLAPASAALDDDRGKAILEVQAPSFGDEPSFYDAVLEGLETYRPSGNSRTLQNAVYENLYAIRPWLMIIDEIHNLNAFFGVRGQICLNAIRRLCNVHGIALLCLGTAAAQTVINSDEQLQHRFSIVRLEPLEREEFEAFCAKLTAAMPLRVNTRWTSGMIDQAYDLTEGYVGRVADLIQDAAILASESGAEQITPEILGSTSLATLLRGRDVSQQRAGRRGAP